MTGRYMLKMDVESRGWQLDNRWSRLLAVCRSLDRDGLEYRAEVNPDALTVTIVAWGKAKVRRARALKLAAQPKPLTWEQCCKRAVAAEHDRQTILRHLRERMKSQIEVSWWRANWRRCSEYDWTPERRATRAKVGALVAQIVSARRARSMSGWYSPSNAEYAILDEVMGFRVTRSSELGTHDREKDYMIWFVNRYASGHVRHSKVEPEPAKRAPQPTIFEEYALAKADLEFWRELERLSGQRERFRDEDARDDEV